MVDAGRMWPDTTQPLQADRAGALTCGFDAEDQRVAGVGFEPT